MKFLLHRTLDGIGFILLVLIKVLGLGAASRPFAREAVKRILVIRSDRIGDLVLFTPAVRALRDHFPHAYITCLTATYTREIVEGNPCLNDVITFERAMIGSPVRLIRFIVGIRRSRFNMAVVLNYSPDAILLAYLSGAPVRVGTWIPGFKRFLTESISYRERDKPGRHEVECVLDVLRHIGIDGKDKTLYVPLSEQGESFADHFMKENDLCGKKVVAIHPGARLPRMRWKREGFIAVAIALQKEKNVAVLLVCGPGEEGLITEIAEKIETQVVVTPPNMRLTELVSLLKRCALFIGNSTGTMHIASALGIPVIALFGNAREMESQDKWAPWGDRCHTIALPLSSFETREGTECQGAAEVLAASKTLLASR